LTFEVANDPMLPARSAQVSDLAATIDRQVSGIPYYHAALGAGLRPRRY
jgi:hypothetical protein